MAYLNLTIQSSLKLTVILTYSSSLARKRSESPFSSSQNLFSPLLNNRPVMKMRTIPILRRLGSSSCMTAVVGRINTAIWMARPTTDCGTNNTRSKMLMWHKLMRSSCRTTSRCRKDEKSNCHTTIECHDCM